MWGCCPVHNENTPSLCLYPNNKVYCFGCHFQGDGIDVISAVLGLPLSEVLKMVANDYGLVNDTDIDYRQEIAIKIAREREKRGQVKQFKQQVDDSYIYLVSVYRQFKKIEHSVKSIEDLERDDVIMAFELMPIIDGIMDLLSDGSIDKQNEGLLWGRRLELW